jgi:hypothetical protein
MYCLLSSFKREVCMFQTRPRQETQHSTSSGYIGPQNSAFFQIIPMKKRLVHSNQRRSRLAFLFFYISRFPIHVVRTEGLRPAFVITEARTHQSRTKSCLASKQAQPHIPLMLCGKLAIQTSSRAAGQPPNVHSENPSRQNLAHTA